MSGKKTIKRILALLLSCVFAFALFACDDNEDLPEIPNDIYTDDYGTHLPPIDYVPPAQ